MGLITVDLLEENDPWAKCIESLPKPPAPIKFNNDPVAAACASYRIWDNGKGTRWSELEDVKVLPEDEAKAHELKRYYRDRLVIESLKNTNGNVSSFRKKLGALVTDQLVITKDELGLLYRLPYFYQEDQQVDKVMAKTVPAEQSLRGDTVTANFVLEEKVLRSRRSGDFYDYWFTSDHSPAAYRFTLKHDNNLRQFVESFMQKSFRVQANLYTHYMRGFWRGRPYYGMVFAGIA